MNNELVSFIVPVYNAEEYIDDVLNDLEHQTYNNIEIIVVDDGSTDKSWEIIQKRVDNDSRIRVVQVVNKGPSKARNIGLTMAKGKYIRFIDSDDRIPLESTKKMVAEFKKNENVQLVIGNYKTVPDKNYYTGNEFVNEKVGKEEFADRFVKNLKSFYFGVPWNKMYLRCVIEKNNIFFDEDIFWCEDLLFNLEYYKCCDYISMICIPDAVYIYYQRENGITGKLNKENEEIIKTIDELRYEKIVNFCKPYGLEENVDLEWNYFNLYYELANIVDNKDSISQKYVKLREVIKKDKVRRYILLKKEDSNVWRIIYCLMVLKCYFGIYVFFVMKSFLGKSINRVSPQLKNKLQRISPKWL